MLCLWQHGPYHWSVAIPSISHSNDLIPKLTQIATFFGSSISGYLTGFLAAPREWVKILSQRSLLESNGSRTNNPLTQCLKNGNLWSVFQRCHAAGVRNGIFDSLFFGLRYSLADYRQRHQEQVESSFLLRWILSSGSIYGISAVSAATLDYVIDVSVKRLMIRPPSPEALPGLWSTCQNLIASQGMRVYRGLGVKVCLLLLSQLTNSSLSL